MASLLTEFQERSFTNCFSKEVGGFLKQATPSLPHLNVVAHFGTPWDIRKILPGTWNPWDIVYKLLNLENGGKIDLEFKATARLQMTDFWRDIKLGHNKVLETERPPQRCFILFNKLPLTCFTIWKAVCVAMQQQKKIILVMLTLDRYAYAYRSSLKQGLTFSMKRHR